MRLAWGVLAIVAGCVQSSSVTCERDGQTWVCPGTDRCDPVQVGCVTDSQLRSCVGASDGTSCSVDAETAGVCLSEVCEVSYCGDGFVVAPEQCDGSASASQHSCLETNRFYDDKQAGCKADCTYDYSTCTGFCNDGQINGPELCDGSPPERSCADLGYAAGFLDCTSLCGPDFAGCRQVNWTAKPHGGQMHGVRGTSDSDVYAVGASPVVLHYDGVAWQELDTTTCPDDQIQWRGAFSFGGGSAIVVGGENPTGTNHDAIAAIITGTTCSEQIVAVGGHQLADVWATSPSNIYAVGDGIYHWDGTAWTGSHTGQTFSRIWGSGANDIYAAGAAGLYHYDGTNWTAITGLAQPFVYFVTGTSPTNVYIVDTDGGSNSDIEHWNGSSWTTLPRSPSNGALSVAIWGSHVIAGTYNGVYDYDGTTWTSLDLPAALDQVVPAMWMSPTGSLFAVDTSAALIMPGAVRTPTQLPGSGQRVVVVDPNTAYTLTLDGLQIFDGTTWTEDTNGSPGTYGDLWASPTGTLWLPQNFEGGPGLFSWTPGSPGTWTFVDSSYHGTQSIWGSSDSDIWLLVYFGQELRHFNGVAVDTSPCATCTPSAQLSELWGVSSTSVYVVGDMGTIEHWGGSAWTAMTSGTTRRLSTMWGTSDSNIYVAGDNVFLHYDGASWSPLPAAPGSAFMHSLYGTGDADIFVSTNEGLFHFDGVRWSPMRSGLDTRTTSIAGAGDVTFLMSDTTPAAIVRLVRTMTW